MLVNRGQVLLGAAPGNSERFQSQFCMPAALSRTLLNRSDFSLSRSCCQQVTFPPTAPIRPLTPPHVGKITYVSLRCFFMAEDNS
jgi:hypothetical protein